MTVALVWRYNIHHDYQERQECHVDPEFSREQIILVLYNVIWVDEKSDFSHGRYWFYAHADDVDALALLGIVAHKKTQNLPRFSVQVAIMNWSSSFKNAVYTKLAESPNVASGATHRKSLNFGTLYDALI